MRPQPPDEIRELAEARATAREARDWPEADRLRAEIEAAGWKVVDAGTRFRLTPAVAADLVEDGRVRYGASASVPSRLAEPATPGATLVVRGSDPPDDVTRLLERLRRYAPLGTQVVVTADAPMSEQTAALEEPSGSTIGPIGGTDPEIVWTTTGLGAAGGLNAGIRRAGRSVVIVLDQSVEPTGDFVTPLIRALDDPTVGVAGAWGSLTADLRRFTPAEPGDVAVIDRGVLAFRREDVGQRGPLDEIFRTGHLLEAWWSLVLRDEGEGIAPRRAVRPVDLPVVRHEPPEGGSPGSNGQARVDKRAFYRVADRFGRRVDLMVEEQGAQRPTTP